MAAGLGFKDFTTGEVLTASDVDGYLMQGIWVFASAAARDAAVTSPQEGNFAYLKDTNTTTYYTGSAWTNLDTTGMTNPMTTTGDIIYSSSGSTPARLGIGSTGQVLTVSGGVPSWAAAAGGGKVLQVVQKVIGDNVSETSTTTELTWLDNKDSGNNVLSQSITPSSTSSKILVIASCFTRYQTGTQGAAGLTNARILCGASSIFTDTAGWQVGYAYNGTTNRYGSAWNITYLHSPASTSSQTYKVQYNFDGAQTYYYGWNDTLTLMEIGA